MKRKSLITLRFVCTLLVLLLVPGAESLTQPQVVSLHVVAFEGYVETMSEGFRASMKEKYGHDVIIESRVANNPNDLYREAQSGWADVLSLSHNLYLSKVWPFLPGGEKDLLLPISPADLENYGEIYPVFLKDEFLQKDGQMYGIPFAAGPYGLAYNADIVTDPPTSWDDLWNVRYQNQYAVTSDYSECNIYITALALGVNKEDIYDPEEVFNQFPINDFRNKLNDLARNARSFWQSTADVNEMKTLALTTTWGFAMQQANTQGQNWKYADVKEGVTAYFDSWAISSTVEPGSIKHTICLEWINYTLSSDIQKAVVRDWGMTPVIQGIESEFTEKEIESFHIGQIPYWENASFWEVLSPVTHHTNNALWKYAISLKTMGERQFVTQREQFQQIASQGITRFERGLQLAREARLKRLRGQQGNSESVLFPEQLFYDLTLYSITQGRSRDQVIIEAVQQYMDEMQAKLQAESEQQQPDSSSPSLALPEDQEQQGG